MDWGHQCVCNGELESVDQLSAVIACSSEWSYKVSINPIIQSKTRLISHAHQPTYDSIIVKDGEGRFQRDVSIIWKYPFPILN
jgi:hypothetical protein